MSINDIIEYVMDCLQKNNEINDGIKIVYRYTRPINKWTVYRYTRPNNKCMNGSLECFIKMFKSLRYHHLLNCKDWNCVKDRSSNKYSVLVNIVSKIDNKLYSYRFDLSRQYDKINLGIDNIRLEKIGGNFIENFNNNKNNKNIDGGDLSVCSLDPMTGYYRDGKCRTDSNDVGTHTVCARVSDEFLDFTKKRGNDLSTTRGSFRGLKDGDDWCLCAMRYKEAYDNNIKMKVKKKASHIKSLDYLNKNQL